MGSLRLVVLFVASLAGSLAAEAPVRAGADEAVMFSLDGEMNAATTVDELRQSSEYSTKHADVLRLYRAFFDREPDIAGVKYWISEFNNGNDLDDLAYAFSQSAEFQATYGATTDEAFVRIVYQNVLGRTPDQAGFDYWLGLVASGSSSRHGVVRWIVANDEFIRRYPYVPLDRPVEPPFDYQCVYTPRPLVLDYDHGAVNDRFFAKVGLQVESPVVPFACDGFVRSGRIVVIGAGADVELKSVSTGGSGFTFTLSLPVDILDDNGELDLVVVVEPSNQEPIVYSDHLAVPVRYFISETLNQVPLEVRPGTQYWELQVSRSYDFANQPRMIRAKGNGPNGCHVVGDADPEGWVTFADVPNEPTFDLPVEISTVGGFCDIWAEFGTGRTYFGIERSTVLPSDLRLYYARGFCTPPNCPLVVGGTATYNTSRNNAYLVVESYDGVNRWSTPVSETTPAGRNMLFEMKHDGVDGFCLWVVLRAGSATEAISDPKCFDPVPGVYELWH